MKKGILKILVIGLLIAAAAAALAEPHVFVPLHWIVGNVLAPPNAPGNFSLEGRTVIFYKEFGKASISTKTINNAGWFVIDTYSESAIDVNFNDAYFIAVENGADKYGADPVSFKLNPVMGYEVLYPQLQLNSGPKVPTLTGISPSTGEQGKTLDVTIFGVNAVDWEKEITADKVHFSSPDITVNSAKGFGSTILANISIADAAKEGNYKVTVDNVSGDVTFSVIKSGTASLLNLSPDQGEQGKTVKVNLYGANTNWTEAPEVTVSLPPGIPGDNLVEAANVAVVKSPTQISFDLVIDQNAPAGTRLISVAGAQGSLTFTILPSGTATLTSVDPNFETAGKTIGLTISGSNTNWGKEISAASIYFSNPKITVNSAAGEGTAILANITIASNAEPGYCSLSVLGTEGTLDFWVDPAPAPTVTAIDPSSGNAGKVVPITNLSGDNFITGASVKLAQTGLPDILASNVVVSPTSITCSFDLAGASAGLRDVIVTNPDGQSSSLASGFEVLETLPPGEIPEVSTATPLTAGAIGVGYSVQLEAAGGTKPYIWLLDSGALPPGLDLNESGLIIGTPTTAGENYTFTVKVTDAANASATKEFKLTINEKAVPQNSVKLNIDRDVNKNIKITWDAATYGNLPKIFVNTGTFTNSYDQNSWKAIADVSEISITGPGELIHVGQVGQGTSEVYYKAVTEGVDLSTATGKTTFASAWAVGKINVDLYGGWNLVSAPFVADTLNNVLGTDFKDNEQLWIWSDADNKFKSTATFSNKSWPADLNVSPAQGYWLDLSGTPAKEKKTVTLAGTVYTSTTINKKIYAGWDLIGNPYPKPNPAAEFTPAANDQIWVWDNEGQKFTGTKNYDGTNWGPDALLVPGKGYWYNHIGKGFEWKATN